jgi:hypothetical protein
MAVAVYGLGARAWIPARAGAADGAGERRASLATQPAIDGSGFVAAGIRVFEVGIRRIAGEQVAGRHPSTAQSLAGVAKRKPSAFFTPAIVTVARLVRCTQLPAAYGAESFWISPWTSSWESMAIFFPPMAAILATRLTTQIEFRNNAWRQVHVLPLGRTRCSSPRSR